MHPINQQISRISSSGCFCHQISNYVCESESNGRRLVWFILPLRGLHQSSIYPDRGEEWQERTEFVILFQYRLIKSFISILFIGLDN